MLYACRSSTRVNVSDYAADHSAPRVSPVPRHPLPLAVPLRISPERFLSVPLILSIYDVSHERDRVLNP